MGDVADPVVVSCCKHTTEGAKVSTVGGQLCAESGAQPRWKLALLPSCFYDILCHESRYPTQKSLAALPARGLTAAAMAPTAQLLYCESPSAATCVTGFFGSREATTKGQPENF